MSFSIVWGFWRSLVILLFQLGLLVLSLEPTCAPENIVLRFLSLLEYKFSSSHARHGGTHTGQTIPFDATCSN